MSVMSTWDYQKPQHKQISCLDNKMSGSTSNDRNDNVVGCNHGDTLWDDSEAPVTKDTCKCVLDPEYLESRFTYRVPRQHYYHDVLLSGMSPVERLQELEEFPVWDDDIIVSGYPKSGTTWLEEVVFLIQHHGDVSLSNQTPIYMRVPFLEGAYDCKMLDSMSSPRIYKTHLPHKLLPKPIKDKQIKIIHILRNPRDIAVSYFHFYRTLTELGKYCGSWSDFFAMFCAGFVCYGDWFKHTKDWWRHRTDDNVMIVTYEEMKKEPHLVAASIAKFCGKTMDESTLDTIVQHTSFENMKNNPMLNFKGVPNIDESISTFMRKGKVGDWKNQFTVAQSDHFDQLYQDKTCDIPDLPY